MELVNKITRDNIGIDSSERAIVWSLLLLRYGYLNLEDRTLKNSFRLVTELKRITGSYEPIIEITAFLYINQFSLLDGGDALNNIESGYDSSHNYSGKTLIPSEEIISPLRDDPISLDSLEKYFYFNCQNYLNDTIDDNYAKVKILPSFKTINNSTELKVEVTINFNPEHYLAYNNLIESIGIISSITPPDQTNLLASLVGNDNLIGNDILFGQSIDESISLIGNTNLIGNDILIGN